nr:hypothetical protein OG999_13655 [Streptomyces sp. NBC_00886]
MAGLDEGHSARLTARSAPGPPETGAGRWQWRWMKDAAGSLRRRHPECRAAN